MPTIKLLALIEASTVTGPAKNLLRFCSQARSEEMVALGLPRIEASLVTFQRGRGDSDEPTAFVRQARGQGIIVDVIRERHRYDWSAIEQLRAIVRNRVPDVIQSHMIKSHAFVKLARLAEARPWIAFHHGYTTTDLKMRAYNALNRWSLPSATRVVTVCTPFAVELAKQGVNQHRIIIQHNVVDVGIPPDADSLSRARSASGVAENDRVVLSVGRLSREKGHVDLIDAMAALRTRDSALQWHLIIAGDGPERRAIERRIRRHGFTESVTLVGHVTDIKAYYGISDVLAIPSHSEGSPNVLLEAMMSRLPVVATRVGGVPEIAVDEQTALLVPVSDASSMARALHRILIDQHFAGDLAKRAAKHVTNEFTPPGYTRTIAMLYDTVLREKGPDRAPKGAF